VPDEDYLAILRPLILSKQRTVKANSDYEASMKVIKYAMSRGFDLSLIKRCIGDIDVEEM
jgi:regulatory protein